MSLVKTNQLLIRCCEICLLSCFCQTPDEVYKQTRFFSIGTRDQIFISRLPFKWAKIPTPKHRESFIFVYPPKTWVTHVFSHPGECKELQPYSSGQKPFSVLEKSLEAFLTGTMSSSLATSFSFKVGCKLRSMNFPRVTWEFSGDKKGLQWIHAFVVYGRVCIPILVVQLLWPDFCDPVFVISFMRFFRRSEYMSVRRIAYAWFLCVSCSSRIAFQFSGFFCPPFSQTLLCSSTVHWPQE